MDADLRQQLDEQRAKRTKTIEKLKEVAEKAAAGRSTPITDKFKLPEKDDLMESSESDLPVMERLEQRTEQSREARKNGIQALKRTTMAVVRQYGENGNGNGADL